MTKKKFTDKEIVIAKLALCIQQVDQIKADARELVDKLLNDDQDGPQALGNILEYFSTNSSRSNPDRVLQLMAKFAMLGLGVALQSLAEIEIDEIRMGYKL